jgi:hypothetical protein
MRTAKRPTIAAVTLLAYGGGLTTHGDSSTEPPTSGVGASDTGEARPLLVFLHALGVNGDGSDAALDPVLEHVNSAKRAA